MYDRTWTSRTAHRLLPGHEVINEVVNRHRSRSRRQVRLLDHRFRRQGRSGNKWFQTTRFHLSWHELNLSSIVPANAHAVLMQFVLNDDLVNSYGWIRKKGNSGTWNSSEVRTQVANQEVINDITCPIASNGLLEYRFSNVAFTGIRLTVKGWWLWWLREMTCFKSLVHFS